MGRKKSIKALGLFILILILAFGCVTWFMTKQLTEEHSFQQHQIDEDEWIVLANSLQLYLSQAKVQGQAAVDCINIMVNYVYDNNLDKITEALDHYDEPNNPIRVIITDKANNLYFNNIHSDNTDGFVVKDYSIDTDSSGNCASFGSSRGFDLEMLMHANPTLAVIAFNRIATGDVENYKLGAVERPIFFQFISHSDGVDMQKGLMNIPPEHQGKLGLPLTSYDMEGLKNHFMSTRSWQKTFQSFEFVTPSYIFNKTDLALRPYIDRGMRTEVTKLSLNVVFNYKTVIDHNPVLKRDLAKFTQRRKQVQIDYLAKERILLLVVMLLVIICFIAMHYTNKLVEEVE
jgi:hypothetical protein